MTQSLRKATLALALVGGSVLAVAMPGIANAGAPDGYFSNSDRYFGPAFPPPAYVEIVPVYPVPIYPAPAYPPAYAAPAYDPPAMIDYEDGYGYAPGEDFDYFTPDGTLAVGGE
jgi:hypothetical protein